MRGALLGLVMVGCGEDGGDELPTDVDADTDTDSDADSDTDTDADTDTEPSPGQAFLRLAHVAPELGPLDLFADDRDTKVLGPVNAAAGTTFGRVTAGEREVRVVPAGDGAGEALATASATMDALQRFSAIAWGTSLDPRLSLVHEDAAGLAADHVRYTVFVASEGLAPVDVIDPTAPRALGTGAYGERAVLAPDLPQGARALSLDLDRDGAADCAYVIPNAGGHVVVPLFVLERDGEVELLAHDPKGALTLLNHADPGCPAPDATDAR